MKQHDSHRSSYQMTEQDKAFVRLRRLEAARSNRLTGIRFAMAFIFFCNFWWLLLIGAFHTQQLAVLVPILNLILMGVVAVQCVVRGKSKSDDLSLSIYATYMSLVLDAIVLGVTLFVGMDWFFAYINNLLLAVGLLGLNAAIKALLLWMCERVQTHRDRRYPMLQEAERALTKKERKALL